MTYQNILSKVAKKLKESKDTWDMGTAVLQLKPYLPKYKKYLKDIFGKEVKYLNPLKDKNKLQLHWSMGELTDFIKVLMYIDYDYGADLYTVETKYFDGEKVKDIKKLDGVYWDMFEDPDTFFPKNKIEELIKKEKKTAKIDSKILDKAKELGQKAFHKGIKCIPVLDKDLLKLMKEVNIQNEVGHGIPLLESWLSSWTKENLKSNSQFGDKK